MDFAIAAIATNRSKNAHFWLDWMCAAGPRRNKKRGDSASLPLRAIAVAARDWPSITKKDGRPSIPEFDAEESLAELRTLAESAGAKVVGEILQRRDRPDPATLVGLGSLRKSRARPRRWMPTCFFFDHDLSPSQQRNIEKIIDRRVIDRTQLILDIFARHARTREGQLQVELAQLHYMMPRLAGHGVEMSQLGGGIGTRGPGETKLETDRRKIARRVRHLEQQLENVRRIRAQQRQRSESAPVATVALVGYTNAGKSTLFNALTRAGVLSSSKMFATLDPTIRGVELAVEAQSAAVRHRRIHSQACRTRWYRRSARRWKRCRRHR